MEIFIIFVLAILALICTSLPAYFENKKKKGGASYRSYSRTHNTSNQTVQKWRKVIPEYKPFYDELLPSDYVIFDLETSGLDPERFEIIEIGAIRFKDGQKDSEFHTYICPKYPIPPEATKVNGINYATVCEAPAFSLVQKSFLKFIGDLPLAAHNARFDVHFLQTELGQHIGNTIVDTLKLSRYLIPDQPNYKLETFKKYFNMSVNSHNAMDDCEVAARLYQECQGLAKQRWLQNRPTLDLSIPDDESKMDDLSRSFYLEVKNALESVGKNSSEIHAELFKNQKDFAVNVGSYRLCKVAIPKAGAHMVLTCEEQELKRVGEHYPIEYVSTQTNGIWKISLSSADVIKYLTGILSKIFDKIRGNYQ